MRKFAITLLLLLLVMGCESKTSEKNFYGYSVMVCAELTPESFRSQEVVMKIKTTYGPRRAQKISLVRQADMQSYCTQVKIPAKIQGEAVHVVLQPTAMINHYWPKYMWVIPAEKFDLENLHRERHILEVDSEFHTNIFSSASTIISIDAKPGFE